MLVVGCVWWWCCLSRGGRYTSTQNGVHTNQYIAKNTHSLRIRYIVRPSQLAQHILYSIFAIRICVCVCLCSGLHVCFFRNMVYGTCALVSKCEFFLCYLCCCCFLGGCSCCCLLFIICWLCVSYVWESDGWLEQKLCGTYFCVTLLRNLNFMLFLFFFLREPVAVRVLRVGPLVWRCCVV